MDDLENALLIEGARSYLDAANAIVHYQQEVQKKCRRVMEGYIEEYAETLGFGLKSNEIEAYVYPAMKQWEGDDAHVGVKIEKRKILGIRWWSVYCGVSWQFEDPKFSCGISEAFPTRRLAISLYESFRRTNVKGLWIEDNELGIYVGVSPEEAVRLDKILGDLTLQWIKHWGKIGGMKKFLKEHSA